MERERRNYAPFRRESNISGVSPRSFAFRPTSSRTLLERWIFARSQLAKPKAQQGLNLPLLFWRCGVVGTRRLRVERNRNCGGRHGANLPSFDGKDFHAATERSAQERGAASRDT